MPPLLAGFAIDLVIAHEVPRRLVAERGAPILSEVPSPIDDRLRNWLREKIAASLDEGVAVVRDPTVTTPVPAVILEQFEDEQKFVAVSQRMADHLYSTQTGVNPAGLLLLCRGTLQTRSAVVVLKLEHEDAARLEREHVPGGQTFHLRYVADLILGKRTRVFKAGFFPRFRRLSELRGVVSDDQRGYQHPAYVANFFLRQFLGCQLAEAPSHTTRAFYDAVEQFINSRVTSPEAKARYQVALLAEMQSEATQVNPRAFATRSFASADAKDLLAHLDGAGAPTATFDKDVAMIKSKIDRLSVEMVNGIRITGTRESWEESVEVGEDKDGTAEISVRGQIKRMGS